MSKMCVLNYTRFFIGCLFFIYVVYVANVFNYSKSSK